MLLAIGAHWAWAVPAAGPADSDPRAGDEARYVVTSADGSDRVLHLRWSGDAERPDAYGAPRLVDVVAGEWRSRGETSSFEAAFEPGSLAPLTFELRDPSQDAGDAVPFSEARSRDRITRSFEGGGAPLEICLARAAWQERPPADLVGRDFYDACPAARPVASDVPPAPIEDAGEAVVAGARARELVVRVPGEEGVVTIAFRIVPGVPYPVEARVATRSGESTYALATLARGAGPAVGSGSPASALAPERPGASFAAPGKWGVVEGDPAAYPFPPGDAIARLEAEPSVTQVGRYLATHPTARVAAYRFVEDQHDYFGGTGKIPAWAFLLNDERGEGLGVVVRRPPAIAFPPFPSVAPASPLAPMDATEVSLPPLDPARLPSRAIAVSDAIAAWRDLAGADAPAVNRIEATLQPDLPNHEYGRPGVSFFVGHVSYAAAFDLDDPGRPEHREGTWNAGLVLEFATGAAREELASRSSTTYSVEPERLSDAPPWTGTAPPPTSARVSAASYATFAGVTVLAVVAWYSRGLAAQVFWPLYTRLAPGSALDDPTRARLLDLIRRDPGVGAESLTTALDAGRGTVRHHLGVLLRAGHVSRVRLGRYTRYFPAGPMAASEMTREAVLRAGSARRVHEAIATNEGVTQTELARTVGLTAPAVHYLVDRLEAAGLVRRVRDGRTVRLFTADVSVPPSPPRTPRP